VYKSKEGYEKIMALYNGYLSQWRVPYKEIDVETSWGKTHVIKSGLGNGKPLVVLHGGGSNSALTYLQDQAKDHAIYNIDIMGEPGKSVPLRIPERPRELADWLKEVLDGLNIDSADIIGMSYGGFIGQWFLNYYPEKVSKLVMIHFSYMDQAPPLLTIIQLVYYNLKNTPAGTKAMLEKLNAGLMKNKEIRELCVNHFYRVNRYCRMRSYDVYNSVPAEEVKKVKRPVLIILGEKDPLFDAKKAREFCRRMRNPYIRFEMIAGMGHLPFDHIEQVFGPVKDFLKQDVNQVVLK
jgi:pimeloyl-ACP methyl ester carboxylesterase